jgi:hypothetical protein
LHRHRADAGKLPYRLSGTGTAQFEFDCPGAQARHPARLRIHTSDQSEVAPTVAPTVVQIALDGPRLQQTLPKGLGIQRTDPAHRAYPATVEFDLAGSELRKKSNTLTVKHRRGRLVRLGCPGVGKQTTKLVISRSLSY